MRRPIPASSHGKAYAKWLNDGYGERSILEHCVHAVDEFTYASQHAAETVHEDVEP